MSNGGGGVPWPVWAAVSVLVALIGAFAVVYSRQPGPAPPNPGPLYTAVPKTTPVPQSTPVPQPAADELVGTYLMDNLRHRRIVVTNISGNQYRVEEPSGSWPWAGTITTAGDTISGDARFTQSEAKMRVEGQIRSDRNIQVSYLFETKSDGSPAQGRVDHHVWYRE